MTVQTSTAVAIADLLLLTCYPSHLRSGIRPDDVRRDVDLTKVSGEGALVIDVDGDLWVQRADGWHLVELGGKESDFADGAEFLMGAFKYYIGDAPVDEGYAPFMLIREGLPVE